MRSRSPSPASRPNSSRSLDRLGQYSQASVFTASGAELVVFGEQVEELDGRGAPREALVHEGRSVDGPGDSTPSAAVHPGTSFLRSASCRRSMHRSGAGRRSMPRTPPTPSGAPRGPWSRRRLRGRVRPARERFDASTMNAIPRRTAYGYPPSAEARSGRDRRSLDATRPRCVTRGWSPAEGPGSAAGERHRIGSESTERSTPR